MKANKFGAVKQEYNGHKYDSKREAAHAQYLDLLIKAKEVKSWDRQVKIPLAVNGVHLCNYFMDFVVEFTDGRIEYHEVKGYEKELWKLKWKLAHALYPDIDFKLIK